MYLHLPLYPLSRPWQGLDKLTGAVCICVTKVGSQPLKQGFYWEWWESWKCLCMERPCISTGLGMQVRTTLYEQSHPCPQPSMLRGAGCLPQSIPAGFQITGHTTPSHVPFTWPRGKHANMPCIHCSPTSQAEQCYLSVKGRVEAVEKKPCSHIRPDEMPAVMLHSLQARTNFKFTSHLCILPVHYSL